MKYFQPRFWLRRRPRYCFVAPTGRLLIAQVLNLVNYLSTSVLYK